MERPVLAITMGDAAGIGPELIVKVLSQALPYDQCRPFVIGDLAVMEEAGRVVQSPLRFYALADLSAARFEPGLVEVLRPPGLHLEQVRWGRLDPALGRAAALSLQTAMALAQAGTVQGVVAAPMNKEAFHRAGYDYPDELTYMAELTASRETFTAGLITAGVVNSLWTVAVTEHMALRDVADCITPERVLRAIHRLHSLLQGVGRSRPTIAVAALNPHAGEGGLFGWEEIEAIGPAVQAAQQQGIQAQGPMPADTVFVRAVAEGLDGVLCMYHDQANIGRKLLATWEGATVFLGLPVVCATTAHGTAFDKAGKGVADPGSLRTALECTARLATHSFGVID
jgi:4-hydroxythreonine-4-phosphate dehydrogenase